MGPAGFESSKDGGDEAEANLERQRASSTTAMIAMRAPMSLQG